VTLFGLVFGLVIGLPTFGYGYESELQWAICNANPEDVLQRLGYKSDLRSENGTLRFFDAVDLSFQNKGIIFRIFESDWQSKSTIKVKFASPTLVNWKALKGIEYKCEWDRYLSDRKFTCNLNNKATGSGAFAQSQTDGLVQLTGEKISQVMLERLPEWGPLVLRKWRLIKGKSRPITFEAVTLPDGSFIMELSTRTDEKFELKVMQELTAELQNRDLILCDRQAGRTREILQRLTPN
jgi:hypothetical protein